MVTHVLRKGVACLLISLGLLLWTAVYWSVSTEVWPDARQSGWSLSGSRLILNHRWEGNEVYLLVVLYAVFGLGALMAGLRLWRRAVVARPSR